MSLHIFSNSLVPLDILINLTKNNDEKIREAAYNALIATTQISDYRDIREIIASDNCDISVRDCKNSYDLNAAVRVRSEGGSVSADASVNRVFEFLELTRQFFRENFDIFTPGNIGMRLCAYVHFGVDHNNALFDSESRLIFGDGDGEFFGDFTGAIDIVAHQVMHGITDITSGLLYRNQSGALNEAMSDIFGSLVKQWRAGVKAEDADWLIGAGVFLRGEALRSLKAPGTAFDDPLIGKDDQVDHFDKYQTRPCNPSGDFGGVHTNSGIPSKAFVNAATAFKGYAWEVAGKIWFEALRNAQPKTEFKEFAQLTVEQAEEQFGLAERKVVLEAWRKVGIRLPSNVRPKSTKLQTDVTLSQPESRPKRPATPSGRKLNAWISNSRPKVRETFYVSINIGGDAKGAAAASVEFLEPEWREAKSLDLVVAVWCLDCAVRPSWQELQLPRTGDSEKIKFLVTSRKAGDREFTVRVYLAKQMIQLQSLNFTVTVAEAQTQPAEAL